MMDRDTKWPLAAVLVMYIVIGLWSAYEVVRNMRLLQREPMLTSASAGWEMRRWFHVLLTSAVTLRAVGMITEIALPGNALEDDETIECWTVGFAHGIPDLLFLSTYSLLTLFWAQLHYAVSGLRHARLRPAFLVLNAIVYTSFLITPVASVSCADFRAGTLFLVGAAYLCGACGLLYFGSKVARQFATKKSPPNGGSGDRRPSASRTTVSRTSANGDTVSSIEVDLRDEREDSEARARKTVFHRVVVLCGLGCLVFTLRGLFSIYGGAVLRGSIGYPKGVEDRFAFDALGYLFAELFPVVVVLRLTRQKQQQVSGGERQQDRWSHRRRSGGALTTAAAATAGGVAGHINNSNADDDEDEYPAAIAPAWARGREPPPRASAAAPLLTSRDDE